jgi:hypothetical protein
MKEKAAGMKTKARKVDMIDALTFSSPEPIQLCGEARRPIYYVLKQE